jgi:hypothetical protein
LKFLVSLRQEELHYNLVLGCLKHLLLIEKQEDGRKPSFQQSSGYPEGPCVLSTGHSLDGGWAEGEGVDGEAGRRERGGQR